MGLHCSTARVKITLVHGGPCELIIAHDFLCFLDRMNERKTSVAIPAVVDCEYPGIKQGTPGWLLQCPHCDHWVLVAKEEMNCAVFRHGVLKDMSGQVPPHADKATVDTLLAANAILGCGQPFQVNKDTMIVSTAEWTS